jgi:hypothetical protein
MQTIYIHIYEYITLLVHDKDIEEQILEGSDDGTPIGINGFLNFVHRPVF